MTWSIDNANHLHYRLPSSIYCLQRNVTFWFEPSTNACMHFLRNWDWCDSSGIKQLKRTTNRGISICLSRRSKRMFQWGSQDGAKNVSSQFERPAIFVWFKWMNVLRLVGAPEAYFRAVHQSPESPSAESRFYYIFNIIITKYMRTICTKEICVNHKHLVNFRTASR